MRFVFQKFKKLHTLRKSRQAVLKRKRLRKLPKIFEAWYNLVSTGEHLNYDCARIHHQGKLMNKVFSILTF